tara:strand:- start:89 stop:613 length:525 start_codon:yes stop_codon:yes gene_type:complete
MNIFYLDHDVNKCAEMHCDKHVVKMILEYAQMLCTAHHCKDTYICEKTWLPKKVNAEKLNQLYKSTHMMHPSSVWARASLQHYNWLYNLFCAVCDEYTYRYGKVHLSDKKLRKLLSVPPTRLEDNGWKQPTQAMPMVYKMNDSIDAYRNYYIKSKLKNIDIKYTKRDKPEWLGE